MGFSRVCADGDLVTGDMAAFYVDEVEILVVRDTKGRLHALNGICPHEDYPLAYGDFDGTVITCANHYWTFDATTGKGINAPGCHLARYALSVENGEILVDPDAEVT